MVWKNKYIYYTIYDDGIYATVGDNYDKVNLGDIHNGDTQIRQLIKYLRLVKDEDDG